MRTVLSVSLPEKMAKELNAFAKKMGRSKSDILKESLGGQASQSTKEIITLSDNNT